MIFIKYGTKRQNVKNSTSVVPVWSKACLIKYTFISILTRMIFYPILTYELSLESVGESHGWGLLIHKL